MALTRTAPPRAAALAAALAAGGTALVGASLPASAQAVQAASSSHAAASTLITVTVDAVPALAVTAFQGSYATSTVAQNGGDDSADGAQDPSGVLGRITLDQPAQSKTHSDLAKNWADAQPALEYWLHGKKLYSVSSVDAHAECAPSSPGATTYVHTASTSVNVLGTNIAAGKATLQVTGAQLGVSGVDHGSLEVIYTTAATQEQQTSAVSGHAHLDLSISGSFYDSTGKRLYSGPLQRLRLGDVQVACQSSGARPSTPGPTTAAPPTPGGPSTVAGVPHTPGPAAPSTVADGEESAAYAHVPAAVPQHARYAGHATSSAKKEPGPAAPENGPVLSAENVAKTASSGGGDGSLWWLLLSMLGIGGGVGLYVARQQRGSHQQ